jgi:Arc/MetJ-type ribon-helix-helix transcriptional regulator
VRAASSQVSSGEADFGSETFEILADFEPRLAPESASIDITLHLQYNRHVITISITVDESLLKDIDRMAKDSKRTRSDICRLALRKWLRSERQAVMVREEQEAYRTHPVTSDEFEDLLSAQTIHDFDEREDD